MEQVRPAQIRNVAFFGHPKSGKTTLVEAVLHTAGLVSRAGRVEDGNTVSDYTPEEHERGYSVTTSVVTLDWDGHRLHLLDTPGFPDFEGEAVSAAAAVEAGVVLVDAVAGIESGVEAACEHLDRAGVPARFFVVSRLDREHADFGRVVAALQARFGEHTVPIALPAAYASGIGGVIDLVAVDPAHEDERAHDARDALIEAVAESDDALLERYLEGEEIDTPTLRAALVAAVASGAVVPVLPLSATGGIGVRELVDALVAYAPSPAVAEDGPALVRVFRTTADPYVGHLSFVKGSAVESRTATTSRTRSATRRSEPRTSSCCAARNKSRCPPLAPGRSARSLAWRTPTPAICLLHPAGRRR